MRDYSDEKPTTRLERTERFDRVLVFLWDLGGEYQKSIVDFAADVGLTRNAIRTIIARMVTHKLLRVTPGAYPIVGYGRFPNTYKLLVEPEDWWDRREAYLAGIDLRRAQVRLAARQEAERVRELAPVRRRQERERVEAQRKILERKERLDPKPSGVLIAPPAPVDVDAWADSVDFT